MAIPDYITHANEILTTRQDIVSAIKSRNVNVKSNAPLSDFPSLIAQIPQTVINTAIEEEKDHMILFSWIDSSTGEPKMERMPVAHGEKIMTLPVGFVENVPKIYNHNPALTFRRISGDIDSLALSGAERDYLIQAEYQLPLNEMYLLINIPLDQPDVTGFFIGVDDASVENTPALFDENDDIITDVYAFDNNILLYMPPISMVDGKDHLLRLVMRNPQQRIDLGHAVDEEFDIRLSSFYGKTTRPLPITYQMIDYTCQLKALYAPDTVRTVYPLALNNLPNLKTLVMPSYGGGDLKYMAGRNYARLSNLKYVSAVPTQSDMPAEHVAFQDAFFDCSKLKAIPKIGETVLGNNVLAESDEIEVIEFIGDAHTVGNNFAYGNSSLRSLPVLLSFEVVGDNFCCGATSMKITSAIPVAHIGCNFLKDCISIDGTVRLNNLAIIEKKSGPSGFLSGCSNIEELYIPHLGCDQLDESAFEGCYKLKKIYVASDQISAYRELFCTQLKRFGISVFNEYHTEEKMKKPQAKEVKKPKKEVTKKSNTVK